MGCTKINYLHVEVPILDDGQLIKLLYKMPQPIDVDLIKKYRYLVNIELM